MAENAVIYTVWPCVGHTLKPGDVLVVEPWYLHSANSVYFHRKGEITQCGWIGGDGAYHIRREGVRRLRVLRVGGISGVGQAVDADRDAPAPARDPDDGEG